MNDEITPAESKTVHGPASDDPIDADPQFEELAAELSALPASVEPDRDLWPDLAARLEPRDQIRRPRRRPTLRRMAAHPAWRQALAAGVGLVAGAVLTYLSLSPAALAPSATSPDADSGVRLASMMDSGQALDQAEMQFLRAKEELWLAVFEQRAAMSPEAWEMVEQNLQILDGAVSDLRSALVDDPGNSELEKRILNNQRRSLDLLREVASGLSDSV